MGTEHMTLDPEAFIDEFNSIAMDFFKADKNENHERLLGLLRKMMEQYKENQHLFSDEQRERYNEIMLEI